MFKYIKRLLNYPIIGNWKIVYGCVKCGLVYNPGYRVTDIVVCPECGEYIKYYNVTNKMIVLRFNSPLWKTIVGMHTYECKNTNDQEFVNTYLYR